MAKQAAFTPFTKYRGQLSEQTYQDVWNGTYKIPKSPFKAKDCFLVCKELKERTKIPGFEIFGTPEYSKDKEIDAIVLDVGPGYRIRGGQYPTCWDGQRVLNQCRVGDIVHFLERAGNPFPYQGETYYLVPEHVIYFAIDP